MRTRVRGFWPPWSRRADVPPSPVRVTEISTTGRLSTEIGPAQRVRVDVPTVLCHGSENRFRNEWAGARPGFGQSCPRRARSHQTRRRRRRFRPRRRPWSGITPDCSRPRKARGYAVERGTATSGGRLVRRAARSCTRRHRTAGRRHQPPTEPCSTSCPGCGCGCGSWCRSWRGSWALARRCGRCCGRGCRHRPGRPAASGPCGARAVAAVDAAPMRARTQTPRRDGCRARGGRRLCRPALLVGAAGDSTRA